MICYRDRAYCQSDCTQTACSRFPTDEEKAAAKEMGLPMSFQDFSGRCEDYWPPD